MLARSRRASITAPGKLTKTQHAATGNNGTGW